MRRFMMAFGLLIVVAVSTGCIGDNSEQFVLMEERIVSLEQQNGDLQSHITALDDALREAEGSIISLGQETWDLIGETSSIRNTLRDSGLTELPQRNYTFSQLETMAREQSRTFLSLPSVYGGEWGSVIRVWLDPNGSIIVKSDLAKEFLENGQRDLARSTALQIIADIGIREGCARSSVYVEASLFPMELGELVAEVTDLYAFEDHEGEGSRVTIITRNQPNQGC